MFTQHNFFLKTEQCFSFSYQQSSKRKPGKATDLLLDTVSEKVLLAVF
jgi:hypothetical protein